MAIVKVVSRPSTTSTPRALAKIGTIARAPTATVSSAPLRPFVLPDELIRNEVRGDFLPCPVVCGRQLVTAGYQSREARHAIDPGHD